jgi:hypothetical protein
MAKSKFDTSFNFGANVAPKKAARSGGKKGGRRRLTAAQKATAALYTKPRGS